MFKNIKMRKIINRQISTYNFTVGRFISKDPVSGDVTSPLSLNRYVYVLNNPLLYIDAWGLNAKGRGLWI